MLTDAVVKKAKPREKPYKLADGGGLYIEVLPHGTKLWRLKYRRASGKETRTSLGPYPQVSLLEARVQRDSIKLKLRKEGIDPVVENKLARLRGQQAAEENFENLALEWHQKQVPSWSQGNADKILGWLRKDLFPWLGPRPIAAITSPELLLVLRRIEGRGAIEKAHRAHQVCGQIFRYAVATGRAIHDPSAALRGALAPIRTKHHASIIDPQGVGALLRAIDGYKGSNVSRAALQLAALTFVRPGELRHAEWTEFDFEAAEWRIPAEKMKMREQHIVPLSTQAIEILKDLQPQTGKRQFVFPGEQSPKRPMSENTVNSALRRLGYTKEEMTGHGFRSTASTLLHELGWQHHVIERQLAHAERNKVAASYNFAEYLAERRKLMQAWANHLDKLRALQPKPIQQVPQLKLLESKKQWYARKNKLSSAA